jgi:hypothetical protein
VTPQRRTRRNIVLTFACRENLIVRSAFLSPRRRVAHERPS